MTYSCFEYELRDHIAHISMSRGDKFNTMTKAFWSELPELVDKISDEAEARVIVLSAQGKHFCAGMDLANFQDNGEILGTDAKKVSQGRRGEAQFRLTRELQYTISCLEKARIPVIAAIQGACIGSAVDMVTACDIRYATKDAFFCIQEINIGMAADVGTLQRLPYLIPEGIVRELAYTGRKFSADEALRYGLINAVLDTHEAVIDHALDVAGEIANKAPLAVTGAKEILNYNRDHSVEESLNYTALWNSAMNFSDDMMEAFKSKVEKKDPEFQGLVKRKKHL
ncbi:MAG TPA: crotonase/enoyl-CoA hydratase family protein [Gammaproteobacteria bacterium]|jgi:enoyl-CoA hydratase|nr:crotonase/enoyl-CoA hydratase family protein [Gammaproteobacteria bacterium]HJP43210.1 crotonase/enoyl-CoA hydratase family protein [Gammaproteobacteria bacterium]